MRWKRWGPTLVVLALAVQVALGCRTDRLRPDAPASDAPPDSTVPVSPTVVLVLTPSAPPTAAPSPTRAARAGSAVEQTTEPPEAPTDVSATLGSLKRVDDYPLYTMHYHGAYLEDASTPATGGEPRPTAASAWSCSLFAALGDGEHRVYGRNFDWRFSPALLLFTHPPDGYASVTMVDMAYFIDPSVVDSLIDLSLEDREPLLVAPSWPFDGMNEHGLVVGMAALTESEMPHDSRKETIDSLLVIREALDHARDVEEAVRIFGRYNISWGGGPALHYLIADASGDAVLVEFYAGEMVLVPRPDGSPWHLATNHLRTTVDAESPTACQRYHAVRQTLETNEGSLTLAKALDLLADVAQDNTQWSVVYDLSTRGVHVAMGQAYDTTHAFRLDPVAISPSLGRW